MAKTPERVYSGEIKTANFPTDALIVARDVKIKRVVSGHGRIFFMIGEDGRVVGAAITRASQGMKSEELRNASYKELR